MATSFEPYVYAKSEHPLCRDRNGWIAMVKYRPDPKDPDDEEEGSGTYTIDPNYDPNPEYIEEIYVSNITYEFRKPWVLCFNGCVYLPDGIQFTYYEYAKRRIKNPWYLPPVVYVPPPPEKLTDTIILDDFDRKTRFTYSGQIIKKDIASVERNLEELYNSLKDTDIDISALLDAMQLERERLERGVDLGKEILSAQFIFCGCSKEEKECGECCVSCCDIIELVLNVHGEKVPKSLLELGVL